MSAVPSAAELAKGQRDGEAVVLWTVGMFCIFGWDYFMNLPKEIERIWKRNLSFISVLYVANRYYGLLEFSMVVVLITTPITNAFSVESCKNVFLWQPVGALISTFLSQTIMGSRVYALYGKSMIVAGLLGLIILPELIIHAYTLTMVFPAPSPGPGILIPCVAIGPTRWLVGFWTMPLVYDTVTFILTLYKTIEYWRQRIDSPILTLLFRDGLAYFAAIFTMNLVNVVLFLTQDTTLQAINLPATLMLNILMSCRLVLNLRASPTKVTGTRGHTTDDSGQKLSWIPNHSSQSEYLDTIASRGLTTHDTGTEV